MDPWTKPRYFKEQGRLRAFAQERGLSIYAPWEESARRISGTRSSTGETGFQGVIPFLRSKERKRYKRYIRVFLRQYQSPRPCQACGGSTDSPRGPPGPGRWDGTSPRSPPFLWIELRRLGG